MFGIVTFAHNKLLWNKETLLCSSVFLLGKTKKSKQSGIYFHDSFSTKFKCKHLAKFAFLCQDGLSWGSHLLSWYKRENARPRCPGTAPSLSDRQLVLSRVLTAAERRPSGKGGQRRGAAASLPTCQPHPGTAQIFALFFPQRPASPSAFITARRLFSPSLPPSPSRNTNSPT